mgnify:FL=1
MSDGLDQLTGEWRCEGQAVPDRPEHRSVGTETVARRGAWAVMESDDYRFQIAIDPQSGQATGDFIHWKHPTLWTYRGAVEEDGCLHLRSRGPSFDVAGEEAEYDDVFEVASDDERRMISRMLGKDGQWRDFMITTYRRKV